MISYLDELESEAIYILREVAGQFENPALLFSGGKDSTVLIKLALKAFSPGKLPFKIVHVDTGHNFVETLAPPTTAIKGLLGFFKTFSNVSISCINKGPAQAILAN